MRQRDIQRVFNAHFREALPGFEPWQNLFVARPVESHLVAFIVESSAYSKEFVDMKAFVQPLYIPEDHIILTFGRELGRGFDLGDPARQEAAAGAMRAYMTRDGLPLLEALRDPPRFAEHAPRVFEPTPSMAHAIAYASVMARREDAGERLAHAEWQARKYANPRWEHTMTDLHQIEQVVAAHERGDAVDLLTRWAAETRAALGVE